VIAGPFKITTAGSGSLPNQNTVIEASITFAFKANVPGLTCYG
jgi:hypothetical protein